MEKVQNIYQRLVKFQSLIRLVNKDSKGYGYKYSSLDEIVKTIDKPLFESGLAFFHTVKDNKMTCILADIDGNTIESSTDMVAIQSKGMNEAQALGAVMTYLRRYTLTSVLGLVTEEDLDATIEVKPIQKPILKPQKPTFELTEKSEGWIMEQLGEKELKDIILSIKKIRTLSPEVEKQINNKFRIDETENEYYDLSVNYN
jgi:hypothetical protein